MTSAPAPASRSIISTSPPIAAIPSTVRPSAYHPLTRAPASIGLGPLADNGGPTQTRVLLAGSPAIDGANPVGCTDLAGGPLGIDQRGQQRPTDGNGDLIAVCDVGAFELGTKLPTCTLAAPSSRAAKRAAGLTVAKKKSKKKKVKTLRLKLNAGCDENAAVTVTGSIKIKPKKKHGSKKKPKTKTVKIAPVSGSAKANVPLVLTVKLPKAAAAGLAAGAKESASFTLAARNVDGSTTANTKIAKLKAKAKKKK